MQQALGLRSAMAFCYPRRKHWVLGWTDESGAQQRKGSKILIGRTKAERRDSEFRALAQARELEEKADRVRLGLAEPEVQPLPCEELAEKYLAIRASRKRSVGAITSRVRGHIIPHFRGRMAHLVVAADIDEFLGLRAIGAPCADCAPVNCNGKGLKGEPCARETCPCLRRCHRPAKPETQKHLRNHLRSIFKFGLEGLRCLKGANPAAQSEPVVVPKKEPRVMPPEFLSALLSAALPNTRGIFAVALYTGARKAEVLGLRVADVHLEERYMILHSGKTSDWRRVAIP